MFGSVILRYTGLHENDEAEMVEWVKGLTCYAGFAVWYGWCRHNLLYFGVEWQLHAFYGV